MICCFDYLVTVFAQVKSTAQCLSFEFKDFTHRFKSQNLLQCDRRVLVKSFHLNDHTLGFDAHNEELELEDNRLKFWLSCSGITVNSFTFVFDVFKLTSADDSVAYTIVF